MFERRVSGIAGIMTLYDIYLFLNFLEMQDAVNDMTSNMASLFDFSNDIWIFLMQFLPKWIKLNYLPTSEHQFIN